jgi:allantoicase
MSKRKAADHRIETIISKWQVLDVGFLKFNAGVELPSKFHHVRRKVHPDGARAQLRCRSGYGTGSSRHIQEMHP